MIRTLFDPPPAIAWGYLEEQIREVCVDLIAINDVGGQVAVYSPNALAASVQVDIETVISFHDGIAPYPPLDSTGALATLLVVEGVLALTDASNAIHEEEQHLIAEAEAWSLGGG